VDYMDFDGEIPEGIYGAGKVRIWDRGEYELVGRSDREMEVNLSGRKLKGKYVLVKFPKAGKNAWLIMKK